MSLLKKKMSVVGLRKDIFFNIGYIQNLDKYLELSKTQKISITENGQVISILSSPTVDKLEIVKRLKGCMGEVGDIDWDKVRYERLVEKYGKF